MPAFTKPKKGRKRHKINDGQRSALRRHYATQKGAGGAVDLKSMGRWFENTYQFAIDLSQVSIYLSPRYEYLDNNAIRPNMSRNRASN
jgi:hypothetical protein